MTDDFAFGVYRSYLSHQATQKGGAVLKAAHFQSLHRSSGIPSEPVVAQDFRIEPPSVIEETCAFSGFQEKVWRVAPRIDGRCVAETGQDAHWWSGKEMGSVF